MALLRVKAPAELDPHVLEAALTRALCTDAERPLTAELEWLPAWRSGRKRRRRYVFVVVLRGAQPPDDLIRAAQRSARRAVKGMFGPKCSARARPADHREVPALWCSVRGTPHRAS
ncbi:hypothetical protein [Pseudonocardia pini]|uniref:hypothetical protein n=1 Tax=Pseudonocardia pini TaxID=2758030 RepID=UPI0015F04C12|nr:hypothetical protein [Pseudonocardia pini]